MRGIDDRNAVFLFRTSCSRSSARRSRSAIRRFRIGMRLFRSATCPSRPVDHGSSALLALPTHASDFAGDLTDRYGPDPDITRLAVY